MAIDLIGQSTIEKYLIYEKFSSQIFAASIILSFGNNWHHIFSR
jgi:hypothetical protein